MSFRLREIVVGLVAFALCACGEDKMRRITVGSDTFNVPSERLLSADIAFLPGSQNDALRFVLNPKDAAAHQILVSVQSESVVCGLAGSRSPNYRGEACSSDGKQFSRTPLRRVDVTDAGGTLWEYLNSDGVPVATCYAAENGVGRCTSDGRFKSTIFSIQFQDSKIGDLPELLGEVVQTLTKWRIPNEN